ncbi:hypothetical protein LAV84_18270 [Rhizobium sp. VS19-DR104.2]|uniref:hypothetical protein n=1 Tax=unclassified Rhizobium TaxID=2613769 RepID=UPI001CC379A3|nr:MULTISPECIES: hypothetical protein [unclassified Rhizobium]MBZ5761586.1 hypothetical protein [Rhizobium sp. VS19-DR96]MBZ5767534.1 hypothetical protein [Rhizobium sp. VS19-DR129.2]MBZ5775016.1 hypothetical protein [Rhizobium sp. VS19-DRK62.2]MBZ5786017.1 hypothetical protein [Rhizobium sp. VS19-DR121]MBZ5803445.1 hypothetical protein [Rhizobium sp. VS19-DR181]
MTDKFRVRDMVCEVVDGVPHCRQLTGYEMGNILFITLGLVALAFVAAGVLAAFSEWQIKRQLKKH